MVEHTSTTLKPKFLLGRNQQNLRLLERYMHKPMTKCLWSDITPEYGVLLGFSTVTDSVLYHFVRFNLTRVLGRSTRQTPVGYITTIQKQKNQPGQYQRNWQNLRVSWTNIHSVQEVKDWIPVGDLDFSLSYASVMFISYLSKCTYCKSYDN